MTGMLFKAHLAVSPRYLPRRRAVLQTRTRAAWLSAAFAD